MARRKRTTDNALKTGVPKKKKSKRAKETDPVSTHKARCSWFNARESWPLREAPVTRLIAERASIAQSFPPPGLGDTWQEAGPSNIGGRSTSLVVHPHDTNRLLIGAAGGGVWSSDDRGLSWEPRWHDEPTLNIGALCIDPSDPNVVYCGTGEANLSADSYAGVGIYRSRDFGTSWTLFASAEMHSLPRRIGRIAVNPFDHEQIFIAGVGHQSSDASGLFVTNDGGISFARVNSIFSASYRCHDVLFSPVLPGRIYATIDALGSKNGIWRSDDGGLTWNHLTAGLPNSSSIYRTSIAIAESDPTTMYAQMATSKGGVLGIYRSANAGDTWTSIGGSHFNSERQMNYNNTISIDPDDANRVICGGVDLHRTTNGGQTWRRVTRWNAIRGEDERYAHADHHFVTHAHGAIFTANDGGLDISENGGTKWNNRSEGLATNMFYDLSVAASESSFYAGGMQDNGTWLTTDGVADNFFELTGGDGGFCAIDPNNPLHLFTSSQFMRINRFTESDGWVANTGPNELSNLRPWMAYIALDPQQPTTVYTGSQRIWKSVDDGDSGTWTAVSSILDYSSITCIEISRANSDCLYVGTEHGGIFKSEDGGLSWSGNIASSKLPGRTITRIRTPATDEDIVYAAVANFGNSHLFRSTDGGANWDDVGACMLPDAPLHAVVIPRDHPDRIIVGGDAGVFISLDGAASWSNLSMNLPTTIVIDLVLHENSKTLYAATYGRSIWRLNLSSLI